MPSGVKAGTGGLFLAFFEPQRENGGIVRIVGTLPPTAPTTRKKMWGCFRDEESVFVCGGMRGVKIRSGTNSTNNIIVEGDGALIQKNVHVGEVHGADGWLQVREMGA
jgi:hypothetical protein